MDLARAETLVSGLIGEERYANLGVRKKARRYLSPVLGRLYGSNLPQLARLYGTDKWGNHWYAQHYQRHFEALRRRPITILEIGIGGENKPGAGGASLKMWKRFFPKAAVFGVDLYDKSNLEEDRIRILQGDQSDAGFLRELVAQTGPLDIVVDDGSHRPEHIIATFEALFPEVKAGGFYAVEDLQTSYWPDFGGDPDVEAPHTSMNFLKRLADAVNWQEIPGREEGPYDRWVRGVHFYHNLAIVDKGENEEPATWTYTNRADRGPEADGEGAEG